MEGEGKGNELMEAELWVMGEPSKEKEEKLMQLE